MEEKIRTYKKQAKAEGAAYLRERRACTTAEERKAFRKKWKTRRKDWSAGLKTLDPEEQRAQKKGRKAFRRRIHRTRRWVTRGIVLVLLAALVWAILPMGRTALGVRKSQKFTDTGTDAEIARANGYLVSQEICDEGYVLLKNDGDLLPLQDAKLNVFGDDAYRFVYGSSADASQSGALTLFEAFDKYGIEYNPTLDAFYRSKDSSASSGTGGIREIVRSYFTGAETADDWRALGDGTLEQAKEYSSLALIVLSAQEAEGADVELSVLQPMKEGTNKAALIDAVCSEFEHVILVINSGNVMELGFINDYDAIDAVLWTGAPGAQGCGELARVLLGEVDPSGRTVDTWPVSIESDPSYACYGSAYYANLSSVHTLNYGEGIYVGYRYYETRFGEDAEAYAENVVFPFGYGLSYTRFTEKITSFSCDGETVTAEITVKNIGKTAGKDVVELYFLPPWQEGSPEKSAIELAAFAKTELLQPRESVTVTLAFSVRDMSSWSTADGCYLLEKGDYAVAVGKNVHAALTSASKETVSIEEDVFYREDETTGTALANRFDFASEGLTTLSRADWEGTWPSLESRPVASSEFKQEKADYEKAASPYSDRTAEPALGAENGILLKDLKGLAYDDAQWDAFLDQFTAEELISLAANGGWHTEALERLGIPASRLLDGTSGLRSSFSSLNAVSYPSACVVSSTWNTGLAAKLGDAVAKEAEAYGVNGWYAPDANLRRTAVGGQNSGAYSEDPLLSGKMSAATVQSAQEGGLAVFVKRLVCSDTELNTRSDLSIQVSEQALRELYLRPFEISVKEGGAAGVMSSSTRLGVQWCGGSSALLKDVLREEWGFEGTVTTDICLGSWMNAELAVKNGNALMLEPGLMQSESVLRKAYQKDPAGMAWSLRESAHDICYLLVNFTSLC